MGATNIITYYYLLIHCDERNYNGIYSPIPQVCNCDAVLWFWATYESAQYCLLARLRTPLGMPAETFTAIESKAAAQLCIIMFVTLLLSLFPVLCMYIFGQN